MRSNAGFAELLLGNAAEALRLAEAERTTDIAAGNPLQAALADLLAARSLLRLGQPEASARRLDAAEGFFQSNPRNFARMLTETTLHRAELQRAAGDRRRRRSHRGRAPRAARLPGAADDPRPRPRAPPVGAAAPRRATTR